jgi:hypothetical protein
METRTKKWVYLLPKIAKIMNSSTNKALPKGVTANEVWFNRTETKWTEISERRKKANERRSQTTPGAHDNSIQSSSSGWESETRSSDKSSDTDDKELSELHQAVKENQTLYNLHMIKKKKGVLIKYRKGQVVLLKIPKKNKQNTEAERLPCRVADIKNKVCKAIIVFN